MILNLLFPRRCVSCKRLGSYFCNSCISKIDFINYQICPVCAGNAIGGATHPGCLTPWVLDGMFALAHYKGPIRDAIHLLKYRLVSDLSKELVDILFFHYPKTLPRFNAIIPVPLHPKREKARGFNQSTQLAKHMSYKLKAPVYGNLLKRIKHSSPQVKLKGKDRVNNIKGAFSYNSSRSLKNLTISLVDDVSTTRATLLESAKVLKRNGVGQVWGIVLAHG